MDPAPHANSQAENNASDALPFATRYHAPVLCEAVIEGLLTDPTGVYVDATLGGGGHTAALLEQLAPEGRVIGIDQDEDALAEAGRRLATACSQGRLQLVQGNFSALSSLLAEAGISQVDGLLLDLGVSSHQLDTAVRGFSYRSEGDLDMRMDSRGATSAHDIINDWEEGALRHVLRAFGEEPRAFRLAQAIVAARPLTTTAALAAVIRGQVAPPEHMKTLSRVFQAIRIAVNDELDVLEKVLEAGTQVVRPGGRVAVISYHSLEDRRVKRFLRYGNLEGKPVRDFYGTLLTPWHPVNRKPIQASEAERAANPRSRSARLRIAERTTHP